MLSSSPKDIAAVGRDFNTPMEEKATKRAEKNPVLSPNSLYRGSPGHHAVATPSFGSDAVGPIRSWTITDVIPGLSARLQAKIAAFHIPEPYLLTTGVYSVATGLPQE